MKAVWTSIRCVAVALAMSSVSRADVGTPKNAPNGWLAAAPRDATCPQFSYETDGGPDGTGCFVISATGKSENMGQWTRTFPVVGGQHFLFRALRKASGIETPRRNTMVRITWQDDQGRTVSMGPGNYLSLKASTKQLSQPSWTDGSPTQDESKAKPVAKWLMTARYEFPVDRDTTAGGWTEVADVFRVPPDATQAQIELCLRWSRSGEVRWSDVSLQEVTPPESRKVRLATVNLRSDRKGPQPTTLDSCRLFAGPIAEAARQNADIVCLPEELTYLGLDKDLEEVAEPIPGPSSDYFGELAKKHDLYIVAGLVEREGPHVYNTAALIGPEGTVVGKYRKVCLTRGESVNGFTAGREYPVFETRFGKVGMMVCWDLMFPESARNLSNNGAEIIALPIAGGDPILARARAIENQLYLITSTSSKSGDGHGLECGVFGYDGTLLGEATDSEGSVCVVEVDLNERKYWHWLGNLKNEILRARPGLGFQE